MIKNIRKILVVVGLSLISSFTYAAPEDMETFLKEQGIVISLREEFKQPSINIVEKMGTNLDPLGSFVASQLGFKQKNNNNSLVDIAKTFLGVPYKFGGNTSEGLDCSALVKLVYEKATGVVLPRVAAAQANWTRKIAKIDLKPGDLVFFNTTKIKYSHVGIYVGDNKFIHAPRTGAKVRVENMAQEYWEKRFNGAHRVDITLASNISNGSSNGVDQLNPLEPKEKDI